VKNRFKVCFQKSTRAATPRGCQTRLHVDVWHTDAWLCMLEGRKKFVMYHPVGR
jgi:hypothetical protein